jgi:hypothetical protein
MICNKIQVLEYPSGIPSELLTNGALFLDTGTEFGIRQTRQAEELNEINKITVSAALPIVLPYTTKNFIVLGKFINPNVHDFDFKPLKVIAYSSGNVITHSLLYVLSHSEANPGSSFTCELRDDDSHWSVSSKKMKLKDVPFDEFYFNRENVEASWALNEYNDGDTGIYFPLVYYGAFKENTSVTLTDMRPWYHVKYLLKKGLAKSGWIFKSPIFDDHPIGKKLIAYLLNSFNPTADNKDRPNTFLAVLTNETVYTTPQTVQIIFDQEEYDANNVYDNTTGVFSSEGVYNFSFQITINTNQDIALPDAFPVDQLSFRVIKETDYGKIIVPVTSSSLDLNTPGEVTFYADIRVLKLSSSDKIYLEVGVVGKGESIRFGTFKNSNSVFVLDGNQSFFPNDFIDSKLRLYDLIVAVSHLFRAKIHTDPNTKEFWLYPNYKMKWYDQNVDGYYLDETIDLTIKEILDSSEVKSQAQTTKRYLRLQFKNSTDARILGLNYPETKPPFSKTFDLGSYFENDIEVYDNPLFEPTINDKITAIRPSIIDPSNEYYLDLPFCVDNDNNEPSFEIAPRILIAHGLADYKGIGGNSMYWRWYETTQTELPYASQLPNLKDSSNAEIKESIVYGDHKEDLFSRYWKRWIYDNLVNTSVQILAYLKPTDFFSYNFRKVYHFFSNGKSVFGRLRAINDFDGCGNTSTPMDLIPSTGNSKAPTLEERSVPDQCAGQNPILNVVKSGTTYTASSDDSQITDTIISEVIEWRYYDVPTWTVGNVVSNPDRPFIFRLTVDLGTCGKKYRTKYIKPCDNKPVLIWKDVHKDPSDLTKWCITASIDGILNDPILSTDLTVSIDGATTIPYTPDTEICGIESNPTEIDILIAGTIQFDNDCDPIPVTAQYEFPPVIVNCADNNPTVEAVNEGLGMFTFKKAGFQISPLSVFFIQYRKPGDTDLDWIIWDIHQPAPVPGTVEYRGVFFFCDTCPPICTSAQTAMEPMMMMGVINDEDLKLQDPMSKKWDWLKASQQDKKDFIRLYKAHDGNAASVMHNRLNLSDIEYCCGEHPQYALKHIKHAIETGEIYINSFDDEPYISKEVSLLTDKGNFVDGYFEKETKTYRSNDTLIDSKIIAWKEIK